MFLQKVYRHNKWMFAGMLFFIGMQALVTWKKGIVFTPWYNYGMYSSVMLPRQEYVVWLALSGNDTLRGNHYGPQHWDRIMYTPVRMEEWTCRQAFFESEVKRLYAKAHLPAPHPTSMISRPADTSLTGWYGSWISRYFQLPKPVQLQAWRCSWDGRQLQPIERVTKVPVENSWCPK